MSCYYCLLFRLMEEEKRKKKADKRIKRNEVEKY